MALHLDVGRHSLPCHSSSCGRSCLNRRYGCRKKTAGTLRRPSLGAIFTPELRKTTIVTTIIFACAYGAAFGAIQQMPRIVPGLAEVRVLAPPQQQQTVSLVQAFQEFGGLTGRFLLAFLAIRIVSRQRLLRIFQVPGLTLIPFVFF